MFSHLRTCVSFCEETGCWLKLTVEPRSLGSSASVALAVAWRLIPAPLQGCREDERSLSWRVPGVCARSVSGSFGIASKDVRFQVRTVCTHARVAPFPVLGDLPPACWHPWRAWSVLPLLFAPSAEQCLGPRGTTSYGPSALLWHVRRPVDHLSVTFCS